MKNQRTFLPFIFLSGVVLLPLLVLTFLQLGRIYLQSSSAERLQAQPLKTLVIPLKSLVWEKEGKEVQINNRMFDVKGYSISGDHIELTGHYDDAETGLLVHLSKQALQKNTGLLQLVLVLQVFCQNSFNLPFLYRPCLTRIWSCLSTPSLPKPFFNVAGPPPRFSFVFISALNS